MKGSDRGQFGPDDAGDPGARGGSSPLDAYLDGQLSGAELSAFEARLARDPALAGARDAQRRIDGGLRGLFVVPPFIPLPLNGHPPGGGANGHPVSPATPAAGTAAHGWAGVKSAIVSTKGLLASLAVLAALLGAGGWLAYLHFTAVPPADNPLTFAEVFQRQVHAVPSGPVDRSQIESLASETVGYVIRMKQPPANVKLVSMSQAHVMSPRTFVLQARVDGQDMLLLADRACEDVPAEARRCGMHQFRREVGGVVFYELSPFDKSMLLNSYEVFPAGFAPTTTATSTTRSTTTHPSTPKR
jgi:anti-sigma factor RsiW